MRGTTSALRWARVRGHLLCLTLEKAIDRATRGHRLHAVLTEMRANHVHADRPRPVWRQRLAQPDDCRGESRRGVRRGAPRTSRVLLTPIRLGDLIALLPCIQPAFGTTHLLADDRNGVTGQGALQPLLTAPLQDCRSHARFPALAVPACMTLCSRCRGTTLTGLGGHVLFLLAASLPAWYAVSPRPDGAGGFLWRWDPRRQRPSIRAGSSARPPMLSASCDARWKAPRRRPHLDDGVLRRPGNATGRLHQHQGRGVTRHRQRGYPSFSTAPAGNTPVSRKRQSAMSNWRATATIPIRLKRLPPPPKRSLNQQLNALSG